ncbi:Protein of unknown function [Cotesia congregata]|uniref:Uncharacterized protein n=1 Tax=Cotesia congregata TaxID=51543 RepID=A0A8J2MRH1_COTCN|nr:Protein of unknown function [Cotesia congregata]
MEDKIENGGKKFDKKLKELKQEMDRIKEDIKKKEEEGNQARAMSKGHPGEKIEKKEVVEFFQTELEVGKDEEDIDEVRELGSEKKIVWVRMKNWEKKKEVMVNKAKLKGKNIFIEDDRTKTEREEQKKLQRCAWAAKKKEKRM